MRRRWIVGIGVLISLTALAAYGFVSGTPEFEFLAGRQIMSETRSPMRNFIYYERKYTFKGEYKTVTDQALAELTKAGYERFSNDADGMAFYKGPKESWMLSGMPTVAIWKDAKWQNIWGKDPAARGWITVVTSAPKQESTWTRLLSWFGL